MFTRRPALSNFTWPSISANKVQSRPVPTFCPGDKFRAALADDDAAGGDEFAAKFFYAEPFADAVAPVANAALTFLMCHTIKL